MKSSFFASVLWGLLVSLAAAIHQQLESPNPAVRDGTQNTTNDPEVASGRDRAVCTVTPDGPVSGLGIISSSGADRNTAKCPTAVPSPRLSISVATA